MKDVRLEPGWLANECRRAQIEWCADHSRGWWSCSADQDYPLGWDTAEAVLQAMSDRFKSWTGRSIEDHIKARLSVHT